MPTSNPQPPEITYIGWQVIWRTTWASYLESKKPTVNQCVGLRFRASGLFYAASRSVRAANELSYDRFRKNSDQIYRVCRWKEELCVAEPAEGHPHLPIPLGPALAKARLPRCGVGVCAAWRSSGRKLRSESNRHYHSIGLLSFAGDSNFF